MGVVFNNKLATMIDVRRVPELSSMCPQIHLLGPRIFCKVIGLAQPLVPNTYTV